MPTLAGAILIAAAIIWSFKRMSQAVTDALARLTSEVSETIADVAQKLADIAASSDDTATAAQINEQADRLNTFQENLLTTGGGTPVTPPAERERARRRAVRPRDRSSAP